MASDVVGAILPITRPVELAAPLVTQPPAQNNTSPPQVRSQASTPELSFQARASQSKCTTTGDRYWSHELYYGPNDKRVQILYSSDKHKSEKIAKQFLDEPVLGFDLEWDWRRNLDPETSLRDRIGLIQIASEDKIALFHIGLHVGCTAHELLAPSLRAIIEAPTITKVGVNIMTADMSRFRKWFGLEPQGAFELSHLHNLVTFGATEPSACSTKLVKLATQVETHLGLPLSKDEVRTSTWSYHLSEAQKRYAAADAYAGFMLYHCMNAKRMKMQPQPPIPVCADMYTRTGKYVPVLLQLNETETITAVNFFKPPTETVDQTSTPTAPRRRKVRQKENSGQEPEITLLDPKLSLQLLSQLKAHRATTADQKKCAAFVIAHDTTLTDISQRCPRSEEDLLRIRNIGPSKSSEYGPAWLSIVRDFLTNAGLSHWPSNALSTSGPSHGSEISSASTTSVPIPGSTSSSGLAQDNSHNGEGRPPATLHTGLSFSLETADLSDGSGGIEFSSGGLPLVHSGDSNTQSRTPSPSASKRKSEEIGGTLDSQARRTAKVQ